MQGYENSKTCFEMPWGVPTIWHTQFLRTLNFETFVNFEPISAQWYTDLTLEPNDQLIHAWLEKLHHDKIPKWHVLHINTNIQFGPMLVLKFFLIFKKFIVIAIHNADFCKLDVFFLKVCTYLISNKAYT